MMTTASTIVNKLWNYCNVLRDDGLSYGDYVSRSPTCSSSRWPTSRRSRRTTAPSDPGGLRLAELLDARGRRAGGPLPPQLEELGKQPGMLGVIFRKAQNKIQDPAKLRRLIVDLIDQRSGSASTPTSRATSTKACWRRTPQDVKPAPASTSRRAPLIKAMVDVMRPEPGETICDPACGTGGFLLAAHDYIAERPPARPRPEEAPQVRRSTAGKSSPTPPGCAS